MKKKNLLFVVMLFSLAFIITSCGKKEEVKLQAFSPEAFAYSLPEGWEVNTTVRVKGFKQNKENETFISKLSYSIDLITPKGETVKGIVKDTLDEENMEEFSDIPVEAQFNLDSKNEAGKYKVVFNIKDELANQTTQIEKEFELTK
jgi:uncharacterized lipoprotein YehR (DUF1307 family)